MNRDLQERIWTLDLDHREKYVLLALARHADDQGEVAELTETIAREAGYSVRQLLDILAELRECGRLAPKEPWKRGSLRTYRISVEGIPKLPPPEREPRRARRDDAASKDAGEEASSPTLATTREVSTPVAACNQKQPPATKSNRGATHGPAPGSFRAGRWSRFGGGVL